jgi:NAD(P)-dependent dehydrogenase (short-subunit alcohol dehydrogenase family)
MVLIIGGGSGIGWALTQAYAAQALANGDTPSAFPAVISRQPMPHHWPAPDRWLCTMDLPEWPCYADMPASWSQRMLAFIQQTAPQTVFCCLGALQGDFAISPQGGLLHHVSAPPSGTALLEPLSEPLLEPLVDRPLTVSLRAEKTLHALSAASMSQSFWLNTILPSAYLQAIWPYCVQHPLKMLWLSAKVGSIGDNQLGGWVSYRASKAALNMVVKTASIELKRRQPHASIVALHPGTTATALSAPFVANVPAAQLKTPAQTALLLQQVAANLQAEHSGRLLNWDGQPLPW